VIRSCFESPSPRRPYDGQVFSSSNRHQPRRSDCSGSLDYPLVSTRGQLGAAIEPSAHLSDTRQTTRSAVNTFLGMISLTGHLLIRVERPTCATYRCVWMDLTSVTRRKDEAEERILEMRGVSVHRKRNQQMIFLCGRLQRGCRPLPRTLSSLRA
jgi:hypothetical protein